MVLRKRTKKKITDSCKGALSLFLCILLTPMLTLASALIEFSRYQNVVELLNEIMDASGLSALANYDEYIEDRFGFLAVSQGTDINEAYKTSINKNTGILGKSVELGSSPSAEGSSPLSDLEVLRAQLTDFSESTVLTDMLLEDLNLSKLIEKLSSLKGVEIAAKATDVVADTTTLIKDVATAGDALVEAVNLVVIKTQFAKESAENFIESLTEFYEKLSNNGYGYGDDKLDPSSPEGLKAIEEEFASDLENLYLKAQSLISSAEGLISAIDDVTAKMNALKSSIDSVKSSLDSLNETTKEADEHTKTESGDPNAMASAANATSDAFETTLNEFESAFNTAKNGLKDTLLSAAKESVQSVINSVKEKINFSVGVELDTKALLQWFSRVTWEGITTETLNDFLYGEIINFDFEFDIDFEEIKNTLSTSITEAEDEFKNNVKEGSENVLSKLVNTINGIFNLDFFYNGHLNAGLSKEVQSKLMADPSGNNPYITLLQAICGSRNAVNDFLSSLTGLDFTGMLDAIKALVESIGKTFEAVMQIIGKFIAKISELVGYVANGDLKAFYQLLLISGYMTHNLPNRTMTGDVTVSLDGGTVSNLVSLSGNSLTGFAYNKIERPSSEGMGGPASGLEALIKFLIENSNDSSTDEMFKGAELEYILVGTQSELMNQVVGFIQLYMLRLLLDIGPVLLNSEVAEMAAAANIAGWVVYLLVVLLEPLCDTIVLVNGGEVGLIKSSCFLTPSGLDDLAEAIINVGTYNENVKNSLLSNLGSNVGKDKDGDFFDFDYSTHMLLLLIMNVTTDDMLARLSNIIYLESAYHYKNAGADYTFEMSKTYTRINMQADVALNSFIDIFKSNDASSPVKAVFKETVGY